MTSPAAATTTPADLPRHLQHLGLHATADAMDDFIARATKNRWAPRTVLEEMVREELRERASRSVKRRLQRAGLGRFKPMAEFDWNWPKRIDRDAVEQALTLEFIREARNLILIGPNGLGKTMIVKNIGHAAVLAGYHVLFLTAPELIEELSVDSPELRRRRLAKLTRPHVLCIDEVGYLSYDNHAADLLYEVVNRRYEQRSTIVTTNRGFKEWNQVFPNATCIATLLDRLTHHAEATLIEGESFRKRESEQEAAARRKKK